jgi:transcriptional regulator with XRE-family HTH domain
MFKENFVRLCNQNGVAPTVVCKEIGLSDAVYSKWTDESVPRKATLMKIADYFGVTVEDLLQEKKPSAVETEEDELNEMLEELKNRSEMKMLFSLAKGATKEDIELAIKVIERMRKNDGE